MSQTEKKIEAVRMVISLCERGIQANCRTYYTRISEELAPYAGEERVDRLRRMAEGGLELVSSRFAYAHIDSAASRLLVDLRAGAAS